MPFDPNASFGKSLFFGDILEDQLFPYPEMPKDQVELVVPICETLDKFMAGIDSRKLDREGELPAGLLESLRIRRRAQQLSGRWRRRRENRQGGDDRQRPSTQAPREHAQFSITGGPAGKSVSPDSLSGYRAASTRADSG